MAFAVSTFTYATEAYDEEWYLTQSRYAMAYSASMTFKVDKSSFSHHSSFGREPYITPDPIVYSDGNEFVKDMINEIIPPIQ